MSVRLPRFIQPMLLTSTSEVPRQDGWALEIKWDGMRAQLRFDGRRVTVRSRRGRDCTTEFPELSAFGDVFGDPMLLDGELVCFDPRGLPDFERLRSRLRAGTPASVNAARAAAPATLVLFDVLHLGGRSTCRLPYRQRRALLEELRLDGPAWRTPRTFAIDEELATVTRDRHLEGIVAKRVDAPYLPGRRGQLWLKYKHRHRERLTVTAVRPGRRREPDELLVSRRDADGQLRYAGGVRFGLTASERVCLRGVLKRLEEPVSGRANVRPVRPLIQVDVDYHGQPGGPLRDPVLRNVALAEQPRSSHIYPLTTRPGGHASWPP